MGIMEQECWFIVSVSDTDTEGRVHILKYSDNASDFLPDFDDYTVCDFVPEDRRDGVYKITVRAEAEMLFEIKDDYSC